MATYLRRTCGSTASSYTVSMWVKTAKTQGGTTSALWWNAATNKLNWEFNGSSQIYCYTPETKTTGYYRDTSAWYHLVWKVASNVGTLYVNGVADAGLTSVGSIASLVSANDIQIGGDNGGSTFEGIMSHVHFIDGTAYDATAFGEYDANGVWKIKTSPSVTYGTNGFFILKDGNSVTDQSGNGNNLTVGGGTLTNTEDNPSNVFATFNPLAKSLTGTATYSNGNTTVATNDAATLGGMSTLGMTSGKWYAEAKRISQNSGTADDGFRISFGVTNVTNHSTNVPPTTEGNYFMIGNGTVYNGITTLGTFGGNANISDNGVQQIALDLDNNRITWGFNGQWMNGSGAYNQSSPSNWVTITDPDSTDAGYFFLTSDGSTGRGYTASWNFGNGYFGTTAVSSAGTNASGNGIFEFDVPTGYTALSTKGLNL